MGTVTRTFWWDRARPVDAELYPMRAVILDLDSAVADLDDDGDLAARAGLVDLVMELFVAGIWVGVVSAGSRSETEPLIRELIGDGLVETIVTVDDLPDDGEHATDRYSLALWELGIRPEDALAIVGSREGLRAAAASGLATVVVPTDHTADQDFAGAAAVLDSYDGPDPLSASSCQRLHRRWWALTDRQAA